MLFDLLGRGTDGIKELILLIPVILFSISFHEFAHGWTANKLGDPTANYMGRLTLNPVKHFNPLGFLMMLLIGFGWATPVPVNPLNFKNQRRGMLYTALAGPVSNLLVAFVSSLMLVLEYYIALSVGIGSSFAFDLYTNLNILLQYMVLLNISLAVFNLIPIYPLDGSRILDYFMPQKYHNFMMKYGQYIQIVFVLMILLPEIIGIPDFVGDFIVLVRSGIADAMISLWDLILHPIFNVF